MGTVTAMAVVELIAPDQAPLLARPFYAGGDPGPITASMAYVPELLESALPFIGAVLSPSSIDFRTKEIVILRTSCVMACRYCIDSHTPVALDAGLSSPQVRALRNEPGNDVADVFHDRRELALIAWTDEVAGGKGAASDAATAAMQQLFADHEIVELTLLASVTLLLNRYASTLRLPVGTSTIERLEADGFGRAA
jgi:AhpD family alkylhydroperoxidase